MWPFKKTNPPPKDTEVKPVSTVICMPGNWNSRDEFILTLVSATNGEYIAAGNILMQAKNNWHCTVEFCERDERMRKSFEVAGAVSWVTDYFLKEVENHKYVIYISGKGGDLDSAERMAFAAGAILKTGGISVKIETAGKAFTKGQWLDYLDNFDQTKLYKMFVVDSIMNEYGTVYSCGMHNIGYKDTIISGVEFQQAVAAISIFGFYQIVDKPVIKHLQTFQPDLQSPKFLIRDELDQPNKGHELFANPFGMWRLTKM